ncbi:hypothetical protein EV702DRAFT_229719 [Suillus placidus]|uniref:PCI domain-containing protein n=1 Tax=Suillus placidus TaxID=48579 RepID=A0A9P7A5G4_9AGAM|nr:hypothetical protein EV702DRAFT_229719 [Suillus placidus]
MVAYQNYIHGSKAIPLFSKNMVYRFIMIHLTYLNHLWACRTRPLERKIHHLSFASRSFAHVGHDLPYSEVASTLQIELSQVEKWVIDATRTGLLSGKLSQITRSLHVYRLSARAFEREQWEASGGC